MRDWKAPRSVSLVLLLVFVASSAIAGAAPPQRPYEPPVVQFDSDGIGLLEAVRLALANDPNIKLQDAGVLLQQGAAQEQTGAFDITLSGDFNYEYRQQELRESRKKTEREKRDGLNQAIDEYEAYVGPANRTLDTLEGIRGNQGLGQVSIPDDPLLESQIKFIDLLILDEAAGSPLRLELESVRESIINENISVLSSEIQQTLVSLDDAKRLREQLGDVPNDEVLQNGGLSLQLGKQFRSGSVFMPFMDAKWESDNFRGKLRDSEFGGKGIEDLFTARLGFDVVAPLGRGWGSDVTGAGERAANVDLEASRYALQHQASASVLASALAYWDLRAARGAVEVAQISVDLQERLLQATRQLILNGDFAQAEGARVQASQARSLARREDALRDHIQARVNLAVVMGIAVTANDDTLPRAADEFPQVPDGSVFEVEELAALLNEAVGQRRDLMAANSLQDSGMILARAAELNQRPVIDLQATMWATALEERDAPGRWVGPSAKVGLDFERPFGNNVQQGRYAQANADLEQRSIDASDLDRVVKLAVVRAARSLDEAAEAVRQAQQSVDFYQLTLESELQKLSAGDSTLIDSIQTEEQRTFSLIDLVRAQNEYAKLLVQLRFESGNLVSYDNGTSEVTQQDLITVPRPGGQQ